MKYIKPEYLRQRQTLSTLSKIEMSKRRIREWYRHFDGNVYISFSGGKDSTVLFDLVKNLFPDVPAVFCDTGLEYPEVRKFALKKADVVLKPEMTFKAVIEKYGYPVPSKEQAQYIREYRHGSETLKALRWNGANGSFAISKKWRYLVKAPFEVSEKCCDVMKKRPFKRYEKDTGRHPILGTMAKESILRKQQYLRNGCNAFESPRPESWPLGFWLDRDILAYIKNRNLDYAKCYGNIIQTDLFGYEYKTTGCQRTGCMFCLFGIAQEEPPNRFQRMKVTHPKQYDYCMNTLGIKSVLDYIGVKA